MQPMGEIDPGKAWWPENLGDPSVAGSSNDVRYAYFADKQRLAVRDDGHVRLYDTGDRRLSGFSSHGDGRLSFVSDTGPRRAEILEAGRRLRALFVSQEDGTGGP